MLLIIVPNSISPILFMIIVQEAIPQVSLIVPHSKSNSGLRTFHVRAVIFGTIQLIAIYQASSNSDTSATCGTSKVFRNKENDQKYVPLWHFRPQLQNHCGT